MQSPGGGGFSVRRLLRTRDVPWRRHVHPFPFVLVAALLRTLAASTLPVLCAHPHPHLQFSQSPPLVAVRVRRNRTAEGGQATAGTSETGMAGSAAAYSASATVVAMAKGNGSGSGSGKGVRGGASAGANKVSSAPHFQLNVNWVRSTRIWAVSNLAWSNCSGTVCFPGNMGG